MTRGVKPSKEELILAIKQAFKSGADLRTGPVQKGKYRGLYRAHEHYFSNWKEALLESDIQYGAIKQAKKEDDRQKYLQELRDAFQQGIDLSASSLQNDPENRGLYIRGKRFYSGTYLWELALKDAGLPVEKIVRQRAWDKEKVKEEFLKRRKQGKPMYGSAVEKDDSQLFKAAINHFPDYDSALRYCGLDSKTIKVCEKRPVEEVKKKIIEYYIQGFDLRPLNIKLSKNRELRGVFHAASKKLGGWGNALRLCGIKPERYLERLKGWDKEKVKQEILKVDRDGGDLSSTGVTKDSNRLYRAACRYYGSWEKAIIACRLDYDEIRRRARPLTDEELVDKIKEANQNGCELNAFSFLSNSKLRRIYTAANKRFEGGWDEALTKAGFNPEEIRRNKKQYTLEELTDIVHTLEAQGKSLEAARIQQDPETKRFYNVAYNRFSTWYDFLDAIGIDSSKYKVHRDWKNGEGVIEAIKEYFPSGFVTGVGKKDKNLEARSQAYYGSVRGAAQAAGMVYSRSGRISRKMLRENPIVIETLWSFNQEFVQDIVNRIYYEAIERDIPTRDIEELSHNAFLIFSRLLTKKPGDRDFRDFLRRNLIQRIIKINWRYAKKSGKEHLWRNKEWSDLINKIEVF